MTRVLGWMAGAIAGLAFLVAGLAKARHPGAFTAEIWNYRLVPETWAYWIATYLPYLEIATGLALVTRRQVRGARLLGTAMLIVFLAAITASWARGLDITCGCFGGSASQPANYPWLVARDLLLLGAIAADAVLSCRADRHMHNSRRAPSAQPGGGASTPR